MNVPIEEVVKGWRRELNDDIVAIAKRLYVDPPGGPVPFVFGELLGFATIEEKVTYFQQLALHAIEADVGLLELEGPALEEQLQPAMMRLHVQWVGEFIFNLLMARLKDFQFRYVHPSLGYGWETALTKARDGDEEALLAILQVFPEAQSLEPCLAEPFRLHWNNPGFRHRYEEVRTRARRVDPKAKPLQHALFTLTMHPELVHQQTTTTSPKGFTAKKALAILDELGVTTERFNKGGAKAFGEWCRHRFKDLPKKQPS